MRRIWTLALKDVYIVFTDRNLLLILLAAPLALSLIIAFAFGGLSSGSISISEIPVAVVNLDEGAEINGSPMVYGDIFENVFVPATTPADSGDTTTLPACDAAPANNAPNQPALGDLLKGELLDDVAAARAGVASGKYAAAIVIPADFTRNLAPQISATDATIGSATLEIYGNPGSALNANIVRSIAQSIANQTVTGNVAITATIGELVNRATNEPAFGVQFLAAQTAGTFQPDFACAFTSAMNTVRIQREPIDAAQRQSFFVQLLISTGSGLATFFALFTVQGALLSIYDEQKSGTLQRLMVVPMPSAYILIGKLLTSFLNAFIQLVTLFLALTLVASVAEGKPQFIWGNPLLVLLLVAITALSVSGVATLVVGLSRTPEQARIVSSVLFAGLGALGGTFGFALPQDVARFSPIYWGSDAFRQIAGGSPDITLNILILLIQGGITFAIGAWLFSRRVGLK
jgi:ABC-type multidrug transport system permease subunit